SNCMARYYYDAMMWDRYHPERSLPVNERLLIDPRSEMTKPIIRSEAPEDVSAIAAVTESAFLDAPHTGHNEQFILAALRDAGALIVSLVAEMDGAIVGNVAVSPVSISGGTEGWF